MIVDLSAHFTKPAEKVFTQIMAVSWPATAAATPGWTTSRAERMIRRSATWLNSGQKDERQPAHRRPLPSNSPE
jgi:hypothetical protein